MVHARLKVYFKVHYWSVILLSAYSDIVFDVRFRRDFDKLPILFVKLVDKSIPYVLNVIDRAQFYFLNTNSIF